MYLISVVHGHAAATTVLELEHLGSAFLATLRRPDNLELAVTLKHHVCCLVLS